MGIFHCFLILPGSGLAFDAAGPAHADPIRNFWTGRTGYDWVMDVISHEALQYWGDPEDGELEDARDAFDHWRELTAKLWRDETEPGLEM